jgi:hypothetical protein
MSPFANLVCACGHNLNRHGYADPERCMESRCPCAGYRRAPE